MAVPVTTVPRLRQNIFSLQTKYDHGQDDEKKPMEKLLWAFHYIQKHIDSKNYDSYFKIAGYHGMPFRGAGWENPAWWGGYCNHGNVLFPTWHRAYLLRLENALRRVEGCADVALPYWDETSETTQNYGIPDIFLRKQVTIPTSIAKCSCSTSGNTKITIHNPLRSYKFQDGVWDNLNPVPDSNYSKPKGYETKRYPFSGLVDSNDIGATVQHNKFVALLGDKGTENLLNQNVINWLGQSITLSTGEVLKMNTAFKYQECLKAPTYTVFSNTTSATQYNEDHYYDNVEEGTYAPKAPTLPTVSLEGPHNDIHLAIGGFDIPGLGTFDSIIGANGDMGENETAAFDLIFYFHHCFIDKVFWEWQKNWGCKEKLEIDVGYPGTNSVDYQGPTPGVPGNAWLTMETPLAPFTKDDKEVGPPLTSNVSVIY
jgi:tyrosinase